MKKLKIQLSEMVKSARKSENITQKELAKLMNTKQESISRSDKEGYSVEMAEKALNAMGMKLAFHHISFGTEKSYTTYFIGGMSNQE